VTLFTVERKDRKDRKAQLFLAVFAVSVFFDAA